MKIIEAFLEDYGSENEFSACEGRLLSQEETEKKYNEYIKELELEEYLTIAFSANTAASTSISHGQGKKSKITVGVPIDYTMGRILGVMHHEIGTHYLRRVNDKL